jgi:hypothetical protein
MLRRSLRALAAFTLCLPVLCCENNDAPWTVLPYPKGAAWEFAIRSFESEDGAVARPFDLGVRPAGSSDAFEEVFETDNCFNIELFQKSDTAIIFYDRMYLISYGYSRHVNSLREISVLCDRQSRDCQDLRGKLLSQNLTPIQLCAAK